MALTTDDNILLDDVGLVYVSDEEPGYTRQKRGSGFAYRDRHGEAITARAREWIESLVIPPAWSDVWICADRNGHLLATGRDAEGRKQYLYHPTWTELRDAAKFDRMQDFGKRLKRVRRQTEHDLSLDGTPRERVLALIVQLMDETLIRVGNDRYAQVNSTYGLTTLTSDHVAVTSDRITFEFAGKNSKPVHLVVANPSLAKVVKRCLRLDAPELFAYTNAHGDVVDVTSADVNQYLRDLTRFDCTAKDFRTWGASSIVVDRLGHATSEGRGFLEAVDAAADLLNNTRAVCRASYVHPVIEEALVDQRLADTWASSRSGRWYSRSESALLKLLHQ
jgi:DNA topoisomerase-1